MEITENNFAKITCQYDCNEEGAGTLVVYRVCPECDRYIKRGTVETNLAGEVRFTGWACKKHGEVKPTYEFV